MKKVFGWIAVGLIFSVMSCCLVYLGSNNVRASVNDWASDIHNSLNILNYERKYYQLEKEKEKYRLAYEETLDGYTLLSVEYDSLKEEHQNTLTLLDERTNKLQEAESKITKLEADKSALGLRVNELVVQINDLNIDIATKDNVISAQRETLESQFEHIDHLQSQLEEYKIRYNDLTDRYVLISNSANASNEELEQIRQEIANLESDMATCNAELESLKTQNEDLLAQISTLTSEKEALTTSLENAKSELTTALSQVNSLQGQLDTANAEVETLEQERESLNNQITQLNNRVRVRESEISSCRSEISYLERRVASLEDEIAELNATKDNKMTLAEFMGVSEDTLIDIDAEDLEGVTTIPNYAFFQCTNLRSVTLPDSVKSIGSYAFAECTNLEVFCATSSTIAIGDFAFTCCPSLYSIRFEGNVSSISSNITLACNCLCEIDLRFCSSVPELIDDGDWDLVFDDGTYFPACIYVKASLLDDYRADSNWSLYADRLVGV